MERQNDTLKECDFPQQNGQFYGRRHGKKLKSSRLALMERLLPRIALAKPEQSLDVTKLFPFDPQDIWVEVGFGGGEHLAGQALRHPHIGFIGAEPFINGVAGLLSLLNGCTNGKIKQTPLMLDEKRADNVRIFPDDIRLLFPFLKEKSVGRFFVLYPDPWPKKRHENRRFLISENLIQIHRLLKNGGELRVATDVEAYADWAKKQIESSGLFICAKTDTQTPPEDWISTRYEKKGIKAGRKPSYFIYTKKSS
ncbi:MAG: tRNA (guanosine(46)-N7)-methyltransferase TrmB [Clostridia bacterium]|nr:tRNA (guanosine(46)-N7)-methyltransferase TrmB [Clostridia bacterium]